MNRKQNPNLEILMLAVDQLGELAEEMVFLGGCATGLLITDKAAPPIRVTLDVDAIIQVTTRSDYYQLSKKLRSQGFTEDMSEEAPLCRWVCKDLMLDVMPTDPEILTFGNKWFSLALENSSEIYLPNKKRINMVTAPYFLITKLEAFDGRGNGDYRASRDIEDIVAVMDGRPEIVLEVKEADHGLEIDLSERFRKLLHDSRFVEAVSGHMPTDESSQARVPIVLRRIKEITENN